MSDLKAVLKQFIEFDSTTSASAASATDILGKILVGEATEIQIAAFLVCLYTRYDNRLTETMIQSFIAQLYNHTDTITNTSGAQICDIVGTGGDGHNTYNVSTTSAILAAACGAVVCKLGNRGSTSKCGSADLLEASGCNLTNITNVNKYLADLKFCYLLAPKYIHGIHHVSKVRKQLNIPTIFNILGPLMNPIKPAFLVLGIYHQSLAPMVIDAILAQQSQYKRVLVVCGHNHLDEISPCGKTDIWDISNGNVHTYVVDPADFGVRPCSDLASVVGGEPDFNVAIMHRILNKELDVNDPYMVYCAMNTAALLLASGMAPDFRAAVTMAYEGISSGRARSVFERFREATLSTSDCA